MAAVIGVTDPKWDERPLLVVVKKDGMCRCVDVSCFVLKKD